jgi:hypothetical protein
MIKPKKKCAVFQKFVAEIREAEIAKSDALTQGGWWKSGPHYRPTPYQMLV